MKREMGSHFLLEEPLDPRGEWDIMIPSLLPEYDLDVVPDPLDDFEHSLTNPKLESALDNLPISLTPLLKEQSKENDEPLFKRVKLRKPKPSPNVKPEPSSLKKKSALSKRTRAPKSKGKKREGTKRKGRKEAHYRRMAYNEKFTLVDTKGNQVFLCPFPGCSRKFRQAGAMNKHMDLHSEGNKRHLKCDQCNIVFYSSGCLKSHKISHRRKTGKYKCKVASCGKSYATAEGLRLHTRNHHDVDKKWKCMSTGCKRAFVRQSDLRMHIIRMHSVSRPYPCDKCDKGFACHSELRRHKQSAHDIHVPKPEKECTKPDDCPILKELLSKAIEQQESSGVSN